MARYRIEVETGDLYQAGTDHKIKIEIVGTNGKTRLRTLDSALTNEFERNQKDIFDKEDKDVGDIECIGLLVRPFTISLVEQPWYVKTIKIWRTMEKESKTVSDSDGGSWDIFPIYSWIFPNSELQYFFTNKTSIYQKESSTRKLHPNRAKQTMKDCVKWMNPNDKLSQFPGYIDVRSHDKLTLNLQFSDEKSRDFSAHRKIVLRSVAFSKVKSMLADFCSLTEYSDAASSLSGERVSRLHYLKNDIWMEDTEFGRQVLNGMNPLMIEICKSLPENFPIKDSEVASLLSRGITLEEEIVQGNVYIIDLKELEGISTGHFPLGSNSRGKKLELAVPLCLLYLDTDDTIRPIAIQLGQIPGPQYPIWTPNDGKWAWLLAKMWFRNAEYQVHQMRTHLAYTHLLVEPFAIATFRCLPKQHPIYKVLREHLQFVIAINVIGRARLIAPRGAADRILTIGHGSDGFLELMRKGFREFCFDTDWDLPLNIKKRGVENLPNYHFRDDAMLIWNAINEYINDIINIFYDSDDQVRDDPEIKEWWNEIYSHGYTFEIEKGSDGDVENIIPQGLPRVVDSKSVLVNIITKVIFNASVIHAAVNFLQFDYGCFQPNVPGVLKGPIPTQENKGTICEKDCINALTGREKCLEQAGAAFVLSEFSEDEVFLLPKKQKHKQAWLFTEKEAELAFDKYQSRLEEVDKTIQNRNDKLEEKDGGVPYEVLLPSRVPVGIAI